MYLNVSEVAPRPDAETLRITLSDSKDPSVDSWQDEASFFLGTGR